MQCGCLKVKNILVVSTDPFWATRLKSQFGEVAPGVRILIVDNLMAAYATSEELQPSAVIIEQGFTDIPEFETMKTLFHELKSVCVYVGEKGSAKTSAGPRVFRKSDTAASYVSWIKEVKNATHMKRPTDSSKSNKDSKIIIIGSSTGGVDALSTILKRFPADCPPTVIVQHTGEDFGGGLIDLLSRLCPARVVAAQNGLVLESGLVCIAAGYRQHLELSSGTPLRARLTEGPPVSGHVPSVDKVFLSARPIASRVVAAVLTGMGRDGAEGLLALRQAGAATFVQDERSSVVYGMPRAAWQLGAAQRQVPLVRMASTLLGASSIQK